MNRIVKILFAITIVMLSSITVSAASFDNYRLLKISAPDQRAVVKKPDGSLRVIGVGDELDGAQVTEVAEGRIVLTGKDNETLIVRLEHGKQRIETYQRLGELQPILLAPAGLAEERARPTGSDAGYQ